MATLNVAIKVNRAITGATTVNANCYAMVTYTVTSATAITDTNNIASGANPFVRYFGPGQAVPATFTSVYGQNRTNVGTQVPLVATYTLQGGVELINTQ